MVLEAQRLVTQRQAERQQLEAAAMNSLEEAAWGELFKDAFSRRDESSTIRYTRGLHEAMSRKFMNVKGNVDHSCFPQKIAEK